ncbi:hypothetical protein GP486_002914 [Trichoglossum hirsutum]|uniref:Actin-like ATPase domain-containing protein n=1 Tax=Trichoglossum hirsutum TaxID=265104 RepID=A0A9P8RR84_9PEZI|nr:hypothetical protein GP486_002914 [Trichoglossum hirsutum]
MNSAGAHRLIVGVDFGTTYTGVSYVWSSSTSLRDVLVILNWPGPSREAEVTYKAPSRIAYPAENPGMSSITSGYLVTPRMRSYSWFKLLLDSSAVTIFDDPDLSATEGPGVLQLPHGKTATGVCTDYLREIFVEAMRILGGVITQELVTVTAIEYWFTVPAIWSDRAKQETLNAARAAGFGSRPGDEINLISEPEAAAIATLKGITSGGMPNVISPGDGILICDCGGGTVVSWLATGGLWGCLSQRQDITTYLVQSVQPQLEFEELLVGEGGKCGSTYIDRQFHKWMSRKFGEDFDRLSFELKGPGSRFMREFEGCKRDFGSSYEAEYQFTLVMRGVEDSEYYDADQSQVRMRDMEGLFQPAVQKILDMLHQQLHRAQVERGKQIDLDVPYDPNLDDERHMYVSQFDRTKRTRGTMVWLLKMGDVVNEDTFICQRVVKPWFKDETLVFMVPLFATSAEIPPRREEHPRVQRVGTISVDLRRANLNKFKKKWKITQDRWVWELRYELQIMFGSREGVLAYRAKNGDDIVGTAQIEYAHD